MTISEALAYGKRLLQSNIDAEVLLMHVLGISRNGLFTEGSSLLSESENEDYLKLLSLRLSHMPAAYITNTREFMSLPFYVDENVLIPRCDTETLVEAALEVIKKSNFTFGIEIGAGSGCISISLAKYCEGLTMFGFDISERAVNIANHNARINNADKNVYFHQANIFEMLTLNAYGELDFIISNPPYIPSGDIDVLAPDVKDFEPRIALDGGADGLDFYRKICVLAAQSLSAGGFLFFEIGYDQAEAVSAIMRQNHFENITVLRDLAGLNRTVYGTKI